MTSNQLAYAVALGLAAVLAAARVHADDGVRERDAGVFQLRLLDVRVERANTSNDFSPARILDECLHLGLMDGLLGGMVGTGPNQAITPEQVHQAVGPSIVSELAAKAGLSPQDLTGSLANLLPKAVDALTPTGRA